MSLCATYETTCTDNWVVQRALAIEAFARALRELPKIIADNGGYDSGELVRSPTLLSCFIFYAFQADYGCIRSVRFVLR